MSIELNSETIISLNAAAKTLPKLRGGRKPHIATMYRWAKSGVRGVKLETIRIGGTVCTSTEAIQRFCNQLSGPETPSTPSTPSSTQSRVAIAKLKANGF